MTLIIYIVKSNTFESYAHSVGVPLNFTRRKILVETSPNYKHGIPGILHPTCMWCAMRCALTYAAHEGGVLVGETVLQPETQMEPIMAKVV